MLIKNVNIRGREGYCDIRIKNGKFADIARDLTAESNEEIIDGNSSMAIPPYVDSHCHLDYVGTYGDPAYNMSGTLFEGISIWGERKKTITKETTGSGDCDSKTVHKEDITGSKTITKTNCD
jgi:cytosine deaminase